MTSAFKHKMRQKHPLAVAGWIILGLMAFAAFALIIGCGIMWLWNWLMPSLFGLSTINYWQAVGMFVLAKILFGGFGNHPNKRGGPRKFGRGRGCHTDREEIFQDRMRKREMYRKFCQEQEGRPFGKGFSKWDHYQEFWEQEGEKAYTDFVKRKAEEQ